MKKDLIQFITENYNSMTDSQKQLADYVAQHPDRVLAASVQSLAAETKLSVATVVRFAQHLGFEGYKDFRLYLAQLSGEHEDFILDFHKSEQSPEAQTTKMLASCAECLTLTRQNLDYAALTGIAEAIHHAKKIAFFGTGTSYIVCQDIASKFSRVGVLADHACQMHAAASLLLNMEKGDVVFGISHSGNNALVEKVLETAKAMGITTAAITTFPNSPVCASADHVLFTQTRENPLHKIAITSRVSQFAMTDSLFMAYFTAHYDRCMDRIAQLYEIRDRLNAD